MPDLPDAAHSTTKRCRWLSLAGNTWTNSDLHEAVLRLIQINPNPGHGVSFDLFLGRIHIMKMRFALFGCAALVALAPLARSASQAGRSS
ncbi:hypothetical protein ACRQ5Q_20810 [Bradyrhizobium sp. PMVTL-01]|uniref:hypothetical protein n=1 Tax=unclassified Bradyrhizobium TaxID=2631580 RepID=UPI003F6EE691